MVVGKNTMVIAAIVFIEFESWIMTIESCCVTRLNESVMILSMRFCRLIWRSLVDWKSDRR